MDGRCELCAEALDMFIAAYGAEAGNLALRTVATAGVYVGGGIAPKILPAFESGHVPRRLPRERAARRRSSRRFPSRSSSIPKPASLGAAVHANAAA